MSPQSFRTYLRSLGYTMAAERLPILSPSHAEELSRAWKAWAKAPGRAKSAIEICGVPIPTAIIGQPLARGEVK